ncbi:MAG TPA: GAF domain-containing protein [Candidatus Limnocylindria bacterium]|jgi:GAF domain-containing protein
MGPSPAALSSPDRSALPAIGRVLAAVASAGFELQPVLDQIAAEAAGLCRADAAFIFMLEGDHFRVAAQSGIAPEHMAYEREHPDPIDRGSLVGRVALTGGIVEIPDAEADPDYHAAGHRVGGYRTLLGVPIRSGGEVIGAFGLGRREVAAYGAEELEIVQAFADQVAIAIRLASLYRDAHEAAERESAVEEVLRAMSLASFDLDSVLQAVIDNACRLARADDGNIVREQQGKFLLAAITKGVPPLLREIVGSRDFNNDRGSAMGRALLERAPVQIVDVLDDPEYAMHEVQAMTGFRTILGVPLMTEGNPVGVLSVWRARVEPFSEAEIRILAGFADQAAVAIRLAHQLAQTTEALERETAIAQVLASIARSSFDLQRVLDTVTESAARLTHADSGNLALIEQGEYLIAAAYGERSRELKRAFEEARITLDRGSMAGRVTLEKRTIQIDDVLADPEYRMRDMQEVVGFRTLLGVPLMRDLQVRGVLMMQRSEVRPFSQQEIALVTTFADQAALAIANVELYETVEHQRTALAGFAPHVAGLLSSPEGEALLSGHRREISALFCDMRGFTAFAETAEPEELFSVLREYHSAVGELAITCGGMVEHFAGDGFMIFFNDPVPVPDHPMAAIRTALAMQDRFAELAAGWHRRGHDLGLGIGISVGYATLGRIGFEGRYDYAGVGAVTNLAARLSSAAAASEILVSQRMHGMIEDAVISEPAGDLQLKGFSHPVPAYRVTGLREPATSPR